MDTNPLGAGNPNGGTAKIEAGKIEQRFETLRRCIREGEENPLLASLLGEERCAIVRKSGWNLLVINPGSTSTKVAVFAGLRQMASDNIGLDPACPDGLQPRIATIRSWMQERGFLLSEIHGIAVRGGFVAPVAAGSYRVTPAMLDDLEKPAMHHASNLAVPIALELAAGTDQEALLTLTDPVTVDEVEPVYRLTGSGRIRDDGTAVHALNHRAVMRMAAALAGRPVGGLHAITCHMGGGMSAVRHLGGRMVQVAPAFGAMPSANRSGALPLHKVLRAVADGRIALDEIMRDLTAEGGLLALAGTNDFKALFERRRQARGLQAEKIDLVTSFFVNRVAAAILSLAADERPLDLVVLTGGLAFDAEFTSRIAGRIHLPLARMPGALEQEALAAGLLRGFIEPESLGDYGAARAAYVSEREREEQLFSTPVFQAAAAADKSGVPRSMRDVFASARPEGAEPLTVALVGAHNVEALLAARMLNEFHHQPLARFLLVGPYAQVSQLCWELDVPVDMNWYTLVDADEPIQRAVELFEAGAADTLMKGNVMTGDLLKGYLRHLKQSGFSLRRLSHLSLFEIPGRGKLLGVTDAGINTYPDVDARIEILENALDALRLLNHRRPKVAVISAVEKPSRAVESSTQAQTIAVRLQDRDDLIIDGPISVDIALSSHAAKEKGYAGRIRGDADLLLLPDIDAGNVIYKAFTAVVGATAAGAVLGGDAPLILTSRGDSAETKLASIALVLALARGARKGAAS